jgi:uncharacterized repeat protein (TIGR03803 family)
VRDYCSGFYSKSGNLYGTTQEGGIGGGTVFKIAPDGTKTILYNFCSHADCIDGAGPYADMVFDKHGNLYGTASAAGSYGYGVVFKLAPDGTETVLHSFAGGSDGAEPVASPLRDKKGNLYGTTFLGGKCGGGTVFKIQPDGTESVLHIFCGHVDGAEPESALIMDRKGNLNGTTAYGGGSANCEYGCGTVFEVSLNGTETVLHVFKGRRDGAWPSAGLVEQGEIFYGTTGGGGSPYWCSGVGCGTIFEIAQ